MTTNAQSPPARRGLLLPLAVLALAAWYALPSLSDAWRNDLYSRGGLLAFLIWLMPQGYILGKSLRSNNNASLAWSAIALFLSATGAMSDLNILQQLALAAAVPGVLGVRWLGLTTSAAALGWLPATGWLLSHWHVGGLGGWERPAFAALLALLLMMQFRLACQPTPTPQPQP